MANIPFLIGGGSGVQIVDGNGNPVSTPDTVYEKKAQTYTPGTSDITINSGVYLSGNQTILGDGNLTAGNIRNGVNIFGVTGSMQDMNNADPWWNNGAVSGKPFEGGYVYKYGSLSPTYYKVTSSSYISVYSGYGSGNQPVIPHYAVDLTPFKGLRIKVNESNSGFWIYSYDTGMGDQQSHGYWSGAVGQFVDFIPGETTSGVAFPQAWRILYFQAPNANTPGTNNRAYIDYLAPILR